MIYTSPREASFDNFFRQRIGDEFQFFLSNLLIYRSFLYTLLRSSLNASLFPSSTYFCLSIRPIFRLINLGAVLHLL